MLALNWVQVIDEAVRAHTQMGAGPTGFEPVTPGYLRELFHLRVRCSSLTELRAQQAFLSYAVYPTLINLALQTPTCF